jgi:hypothetical protein
LAKAGVRLIQQHGVMKIGVWSWRDNAALRAALRTCESESAPIVYLDGPGVPHRFKEFRGAKELDGEPLPLEFIEAMYQHPEEPWKIRDQLLQQMAWHPGTSEAEWHRILINRVFARDATAEKAAALLERTQLERKAWIEGQRRIQRGWAKWMRWRTQSPEEADAFRRQHQDADGGDQGWLVDFASRTVPRAKTTTTTVSKKSTKRR